MNLPIMAVIFLLSGVGIIVLAVQRTWSNTVSLVCLVLIFLLSILSLFAHV